ncbi:hypothetical protein TNCV_897031 [Trichonephila clavipes]|nr:hypothetical protein TNCV_897031 [Trichonephila clavipes]
MASSRQCPRFPKLKTKTKKEETPTNKNPINQRQVRSDVSYANVCSNKIEKQMAPREETPKSSNQSPSEKHQDKAEPNFKFENFATYINELHNLTSKFPEIFRALEDMSKTNNDIEKFNIFLNCRCTIVQQIKTKIFFAIPKELDPTAPPTNQRPPVPLRTLETTLVGKSDGTLGIES